MTISEAATIAAERRTGIYRKDKYPHARGFLILSNYQGAMCTYILRGYGGRRSVITAWSPTADDLTTDQWEPLEAVPVADFERVLEQQREDELRDIRDSSPDTLLHADDSGIGQNQINERI